LNIIIENIVKHPAGSGIIRTGFLILRAVRSLSMFNIAYYFYPMNPPDVPGYVTAAGRKGISGFASGKESDIPLKIELLVDGQVINTTYAAQKIYYPFKYYGEFIGFYFPMKAVWNYINKRQKIEVHADGKPLKFRAGKRGNDLIPNYGNLQNNKDKSVKNITVNISEGNLINKFGRIQPPRNTNSGWTSKVFSSFETANELFEKEFGKKLYVFYGSLLGFAREGGIIPYDCDMDLAYFSEENDAKRVRNEFYEIAEKLGSERKDVLFSVSKINFPKMRISVTPTWITPDGDFACTFAYVGDKYKVTRDDVLPLQKIVYEGYELNLPANPVNIVKYVYGRGWKYPDPGWKWLIEYKLRPEIFKARLTNSQVKKLNKIILR
jgi:hypothetical protein